MENGNGLLNLEWDYMFWSKKHPNLQKIFLSLFEQINGSKISSAGENDSFAVSFTHF